MVDAVTEALKGTEYKGVLGGCYKKRGADGAKDTSLYAEKAITFKFTEAVAESADGGDGGDGGAGADGEDSAFAYSMAGVVLATAALAF